MTNLHITITDITIDPADDGEPGAMVRIGARVGINGAKPRDTIWYAGPLGDGLGPAGDSIDCWADPGVLAAYGVENANTIGREVIARAGVAR